MTTPARPSSTLFEIHVIDRRTGIWCDECALPSVVEVDGALAHATCLAVLARSTCWLCTSCGAHGTRPRGETTP